MAPCHELDGVGNHLPADERRLHPLGAHSHPVRHRDGVELHGSAASGPYTLFDVSSQVTLIEVAGHRLGPARGDADNRPAQVLVREPCAFEHGPGRCSGRPVGEGGAALFQGTACHRDPPPRPAPKPRIAGVRREVSLRQRVRGIRPGYRTVRGRDQTLCPSETAPLRRWQPGQRHYSPARGFSPPTGASPAGEGHLQ